MPDKQSEPLHWQKLYSDEAKRNRELTDFKTEASRGLFELAAFYAIIWGIALASSLVITHSIAWLMPALPQWLALFPIFSTLLIVGGILIFFDSLRGKQWEVRVKLWARQYGYPITLLLGIGLAWLWESTTGQYTIEAQAQRAAMKACAQIPSCVQMAETLNQGNGVLYYLPQ